MKLAGPSPTVRAFRPRLFRPGLGARVEIVQRVLQVRDLRYWVVTYASPDADDSLPVVVAVDDGGRSAFKPLVRNLIVGPDQRDPGHRQLR
ncbi:hypothetical protein [Micromonospora sp. NPDC005203]|uniref:hypothetical protein n=1 Tax=Micromonospora sp. NPDC005203 TaxID=3364226 RepID=UPI003699B845